MHFYAKRGNGALEPYIFTLNLEMGGPELYVFMLNMEMGASHPYIFALNLKNGVPDLEHTCLR